jgi:Mg2+-importing ATPase
VVSSLAVAVLAFALPYLPFARLFDFVPLAPELVVAIIGVTVAYVLASELTKQRLRSR